MTRMSPADQMAALERWLADHPARQAHSPRTEERMAALADGRTVRPDVEAGRTQRDGWQRWSKDERGWVREGYGTRWEPDYE